MRGRMSTWVCMNVITTSGLFSTLLTGLLGLVLTGLLTVLTVLLLTAVLLLTDILRRSRLHAQAQRAV